MTVFNEDDDNYEDSRGSQVATNAAIVRQGFSSEELALQNETAAIAVAAAAKAAIESRYILAMKRPRDWDVTRDKLMKECNRPGFAESAIYKKPMGNKFNEDTGKWEKAFVEGLSVRFAEAALRYMTNVYADATSIYDDAQKSILRVTVTDLESNATVAMDVTVAKTVERSKLKNGQIPLRERINSSGKRVYIVEATDDDILNKVNALVSKALRNGVLRLLPGDIQDECEAKCRETQVKKDKEDPAAAKKKIFDGFSGIGIGPDQLKLYLGHDAQTLQPKELVELRAIFAAIRDGETTWAAIMADREPTDAGEGGGKAPAKSGATSAVDELVRKQAEKKAKAAQGQGGGAEKGSSKSEGEGGGKAEAPGKSEGKSEPSATGERQPGEDG